MLCSDVLKTFVKLLVSFFWKHLKDTMIIMFILLRKVDNHQHMSYIHLVFCCLIFVFIFSQNLFGRTKILSLTKPNRVLLYSFWLQCWSLYCPIVARILLSLFFQNPHTPYLITLWYLIRFLILHLPPRWYLILLAYLW